MKTMQCKQGLQRHALAFAVAALVLISGCGPHGSIEVSPTPAAPPVSFRDVTGAAGLRFVHVNGAAGRKWLPETMGSGCAFLDYDNDGWQDILLISGDDSLGRKRTGSRPAAPKAPSLRLYHNNHDGTFTDVTAREGLDLSLYGMGVAVGDFDNDGWDDLFITCVGRSLLFHNVSDGHGGRRFVDVTSRSGIEDRGFATSCAWVDYDRDGRLDLFVCHYVVWAPERESFYSVSGGRRSYARPSAFTGETCRLYHNLGGGRFADVTRKAGIQNARSKALGVAVSDYDSDGWPDIFVANDTEPNLLYHNQGDGTFKEVGVVAGIALSEQGTSRAGMGIDAADTRHTGSFDVLITNFSGEQLTLYRRDASGIFQDVAAQSGVGIATQTYLGFGAFFFDYDLDGWPDLFVNNGHIDDDIGERDAGVTYAEPALLFRNLGNGHFSDVSEQCGPAFARTTRRVGRGAAWGDFDNDGHPDLLLMANNGRAELLRSENSTGNGWIRLQLAGTASNRDAYGARVQVRVGRQVQTQELRSGSSYLSASDHRLLFGLGSAAKADEIVVRWPSGKVQSLGPVRRMAPGGVLKVTEER